jgi:polysaccharide pyruvyl transferase WcaK-like protein
MPIGIVFALRRRPILILGVGGGPISNKVLRKVICFIMNHAKVITVRDEETAKYFKSYGVKKELIITSDTAQIIKNIPLPALDKRIDEEIQETFKDKKIIFFHAHPNEEIDRLLSKKIVPALNEFLREHKEYGILIYLAP